jgi:carboxypeptidase family protein/TonB-dependent receptor-like protein
MLGLWRGVLVGVCLLVAAGRTGAQETGTITGTVLDKSSGDPIIEAGVEVVGTGKTVRTDLDGKYRIAVPPGNYEVRIFAPLYQGTRLQNVSVKAGQAARADAALAATTGKAGVEVVEVIAQANRATESTQLLKRKKAAVVSDTLSAETMKKTPGSAAADVVKRAPAVTVKDNKYVYVRGLSERYTNAILNGSRLPSTDPERRVVPLDLFPAEFLESLAIIKSYTPDLPGDFSGGLVDLHLRDFPEQLTLGVGLQGNVNTQVTGKDFNTYRGSTADYWGFGRLIRRQPGAVPDDPGARSGPRFDTIGRTFLDNWAIERDQPPPGWGGTVVAGNSWGPFGLQIGGIYQNEYFRRDEHVRQFIQSGVSFGTPKPVVKDDYHFDYSTYTTKLGGVLSSALKLDDDNKLAFRAFINRNSYDEVLFGQGQNDNLGFDTGQIQQQTRLRWGEEELDFMQLAGEHHFTLLDVDWRTAVARTTLDEPDMRHLTYRGPIGGPLGFTNDSSGGLRLFNTMKERMSDSAADAIMPFLTGLPFTDAWSGLPGKLKFGPAYTYRARQYAQRRFVDDLSTAGGALDLTLPPEELLAPSNLGPGGYSFEEQTQPRDLFSASQEVIGGYGMFDLPLVRDWLRFVGGSRLEYSLIQLDTADDQGAPLHVGKKDIDPLPGANLILTPRNDMNVRLSYSRTVTRPEFRELSPVEYPAPRGLRPLIGNPDLVETKIESYDLRWEWFLSPLELTSMGVYFKSLKNPIEQVVIQQSSNIADSFVNADTGEVLGLEFEVRKDFGFVGPRWKDLSLLTNATWQQTSVTVGPRSQFQAQTSSQRELQGAAPFVINAVLDYTHPRFGTARILYYTAGPRIATVGAFGLPDIIEQRRDQLDVVFILPLKEFTGYPLTWKMSAENILNDPVLLTQGALTQRRFSTGAKFTFGVSYSY